MDSVVRSTHRSPLNVSLDKEILGELQGQLM